MGALPGAADAATRLNLDAEARRAAELAASVEPAQSLRQVAEALLDACKAELDRAPEPRRAARLHYEMARLYAGPLEDPQAATRAYREAHRLAPDHLPSLRGARQALVGSGTGQAAAPLFDKELQLTRDAGQKAALLHEKAELEERALGKPADARKTLQATLDFDASSSSAASSAAQSLAR